MKNMIRLVGLLLFFVAASMGRAQGLTTLLSVLQMSCRTNQATPMVAVAVPTGTPTGFVKVALVCAVLDPATLRVDTSVTPSVLRVIVPTSSGPVFVDGETPGGVVDGLNAVFTLAFTPVPNTSLAVYRNGVRLALGMDYALAGSTISFLAGAIPEAGAVLRVDYRR